MKYIQQTSIYSVIIIIFIGMSWVPAYGQLQIGDVLPKNRMEELKKMSSPDFPVPASPVKLYLIDFWSRWCGTCIASFPKVEGLQYRLRDQVRILAINPWNDDEELKELFAMYQGGNKKKKTESKSGTATLQVIPYVTSAIKPRMTSLPASNGDKSWLDLFEIDGVPHYVWIDDKGKILAVTNVREVNPGNIYYYLQTGKLPRMTVKTYPGQYNLRKQSLAEVWGQDVFPYKSDGLMMRDYYGGDGGAVFGYDQMAIVDSAKGTIRYSFVNTTISDLYKAAWTMASSEQIRPYFQHGRYMLNKGDTVRYTDVVNERIIWNLSLPDYYVGPTDNGYISGSEPGFNEWSFRARFCAELELPLHRKEEAAGIFLNGLNNYLTKQLGIHGRIEMRKRACLVLKKKADFKPGANSAVSPTTEYNPQKHVERYVNMPFENIFHDFLPYRIEHTGSDRFWNTNSRGRYYMPRMNRQLPLIDETGIMQNVNLALNDVPDEIIDPLEAMNFRLKGTGLYVEKEIREIEMLVITDQLQKP